nr:copia protein [Tanacetum cinerariifolium]
MAEQLTIKYAPQWNNMTVDNDPSKVTEIELTAHMIAVNNQRNSVSSPPLVAKPKKGKSQTITSTSPKSQGPEALGALFKKSKRPLSKKPPTETKVTPPQLTEGSEDSRGNKQPLDRNIIFTTLDEDTTKTTPRPEGSRGDKDSGENKPPADMELQNPNDTNLSGTDAKYQEDQTQSSTLRYQSLIKNEGKPSYEGEPDTQPMLLTYANVRAILLSEDEAQESEEDILGAAEEMDDNPQSAETQHQSSPPQEEKQTSSTAPHTKASDIDSSSDKILRKYDDTLPLTKRQLEEAVIHYVNLKDSIDHYRENIAHIDQTDQLVEASVSFLEKRSSTINDLYKGLEVITQLLKDIKNSIKDDPAITKKIKEASETLAKISTRTTKILFLVRSFDFSTLYIISTFALTNTPANVDGENATHTATKKPPSHTGGGTDANIQDKPKELRQSTYANFEFIGSSTHLPLITQAQPNTIIHPEPSVPQRKGKVYRGTDGRNFDVHKPFLFGAFSISELDELREIIPKKKNTVVKDLMNSLSQRYERLRKIPGELGIQSALPALKQTLSQTSRRKQKHMELETKTRILGLECNETLPKNVSFVNNMVIKEPEYGIFFTDEFGDQAFQKWSDIDKEGMEALVSYLVDASMVKSPKNARFSMKLRKLIAEHPAQEKLKSKKVKLEALGYNMD